jgi:polysaccharide biosynthesis protein PelD
MLEQLARRIGFDVTMIVIRLENFEDLTVEQQGRVPLALSRAVRQVLRRTDLAFDYRKTGQEFALVLPATRVEGAQVVIGKMETTLLTELALEAPQARFTFGAQAIHDTRGAQQEAAELENAELFSV